MESFDSMRLFVIYGFIWFCCFIQSYPTISPAAEEWQNNYAWKSIVSDTTGLIELRGFKAENHTVLTPDGYLIQIFRIVNPRRIKRGYPMIVFQGLGLSSEQFLITADGIFHPKTAEYIEFENNLRNQLRIACPPNVRPTLAGRNLVLTLATCGFDVWLANMRDATAYSSNLVLHQSDAKFWNTNLDIYSEDSKTLINYVLSATGSVSLGAICHSVGCNSLFQLMTIDSNSNEQIRPLIALAPYVFIHHMTSPVITFVTLLEPIFKNIEAPTPDLQSILPAVATLVRTNKLVRFIYVLVYSIIGGANFDEIDVDRIYRLAAHFPTTVSYRLLAHVGQRRFSDNFYRYDYGPAQNQIVYGSPVPPVYDLSQITNRHIVAFSGSNDTLGDLTDFERLRSAIRVPFYASFTTSYSHGDFIFGNHCNRTVNLPVLQILHQLALNYN